MEERVCVFVCVCLLWGWGEEVGVALHLTVIQIMIIMLAGSKRLDTSIVYDSVESLTQFPQL